MRKFIMQNGCINRVEYLGELFKQINCPSVILGVKKTICQQKIFVSRSDEEWILPETTVVSAESFIFCSPEEQNIIDQMESVENCSTLAGNAEFALGIVTGDNKKHLYHEPQPQAEAPFFLFFTTLTAIGVRMAASIRRTAIVPRFAAKKFIIAAITYTFS